MKTLLLGLLIVLSSAGLAQSTVTISNNITQDRTFHCDTIYILDTAVFVENGATLTIQAGTVIKGTPGMGVDASFLIIAKGAKIEAIGTPAHPIIFTSTSDDITNAHPNYPGWANLDTSITNTGLWGGLIVLGDAQISAVTPSIIIEGLPIDPISEYGGNNNTDNSGTIQYVSIRHGGTNIGLGNEIGGLTLAAIGAGTTVDHIELLACQDDGLDVFGGVVNISHVISTSSYDDGIDTDQGYSGTIDNFIVYDANDASIELDGPEGADLGLGNHELVNGTVFLTEDSNELTDTDANTNVDMSNVFWFGMNPNGYSYGQIFTELPTTSVVSPTFSNLEVAIPTGESVTDYFLNGTSPFALDLTVGSQTVGAIICEFAGWSSSYVEGLLTTDFVVNSSGCIDPISGNYCQYATSSTNCNYDTVLSCGLTIGLAENPSGLGLFEVYPNPTNDQFIIDLSSGDLNANYYSVVDTRGRIIAEGVITNNLTQVSAHLWSKGMYILNLRSENGLTTTKILKE